MEALDVMNNSSNNLVNNVKGKGKGKYQMEQAPHNNTTPIRVRKRCLY
jgi:hypothetical protein